MKFVGEAEVENAMQGAEPAVMEAAVRERLVMKHACEEMTEDLGSASAVALFGRRFFISGVVVLRGQSRARRFIVPSTVLLRGWSGAFLVSAQFLPSSRRTS